MLERDGCLVVKKEDICCSVRGGVKWMNVMISLADFQCTLLVVRKSLFCQCCGVGLLLCYIYERAIVNRWTILFCGD